MISLWCPGRLLMAFLAMATIVSLVVHAQEIPADLLQKAVDFVKQTEHDPSNTLSLLNSGNIHTLYQVAKSMNSADPVTSTQIWLHLADDNHILSQVALGFAFSEQDKARAIAYFVQAGENGPHQAALYNAGRLLVETRDFPKALAYMRAAATMEDETYATPEMTRTCEYAYNQLSSQLMELPQLALQDAADMFLYASLADFPFPKSKEEKIWGKAMNAIQSDNPKEATKQLGKLEGNENLSELQIHLLKALQAHLERANNDEL